MADYGKLLVNVTTDEGMIPIRDARILIYVNQTDVQENQTFGMEITDSIVNQTPIFELFTDESGQTTIIELETPPLNYSENPNEPQPYTNYSVQVQADGYETVLIHGVELFPGEIAIQDVKMKATGRTNNARNFPVIRGEDDISEGIPAYAPDALGADSSSTIQPDAFQTDSTPQPNITNLPLEIIDIPPHTLYGNYPPKIPESEIKPISETGEIVLSRVVIPEYIIVHDGVPSNSSAKNYYVKYKDYIKNVVSCEIYSTWPESTIYANTLAIMSFTLNRVYTEWYRNKGYNFTITSSTAYDQKWVYGKTIYKNINYIVDSVFNNYLSRPGVRQPIFTSYCDGSQTTCRGMSQWGSKYLGEQGYSALRILRYYYGNDIYINTADSISGVASSWPGYNLSRGSRGQKVQQMQSQLNRIGRNYPAIKQITADGIFGAKTAEAVRTFQKVFSLPVTGVVDFATWYEISSIYVAVANLSEPR